LTSSFRIEKLSPEVGAGVTFLEQGQ